MVSVDLAVGVRQKLRLLPIVVAGAFKRAEPAVSEADLLMRALRDFNIPKIVADDTPVFQGLISDLFPNLEVPRSKDQIFEKAIKVARKKPKFFSDCVEQAVMKFYKLFRDKILQLILVYPLDKVNPDGRPFWSLPKREPTP